jgi:hypothetical protein
MTHFISLIYLVLFILEVIAFTLAVVANPYVYYFVFAIIAFIYLVTFGVALQIFEDE